jgi:drug/metabolite transporter (DMT)-like permease
LQRFMMRPIGLFTMAIFVTLLWGSPPSLIKLSYEWLSIDPNDFSKEILFAGYRFLLSAALLYLFITFTTKKKIFSKAALRSLSKVGFIQNFLQYGLFYIGVSMSSSMVTVILTGTTSLFQILITHFLDTDDRLNLRKVAGIVVGFLGILVVSLHSVTTGTGIGWGEILLILSNLAAAVGNLLARKETAKFDVGVITFFQLFIGSLCLIAVSIWKAGFFPFSFDLQSSFVFIYLALVAVTGTYLWNLLLHFHPVSKVSMFLFLIPVFGVFYSSIFLSEELTVFTSVGLIFVTIGILIVNVSKKMVSKRA